MISIEALITLINFRNNDLGYLYLNYKEKNRKSNSALSRKISIKITNSFPIIIF